MITNKEEVLPTSWKMYYVPKLETGIIEIVNDLITVLVKLQYVYVYLPGNVLSML